MTWHKKGTGTSAPAAKPKTPTVAKPKAPTTPKTSVPKPTVGKAPAVKPVSSAKDAKLARTGTYASKKPAMGGKHSPVKKGHVK